MTGRRSDPHDLIWERLRRVIFDAVHALLGPPPPDVLEKIEDALRDARREWQKSGDDPDQTG